MIDSKILTLLKVVETGNYTAAGKQLNLTQPAVTQHIQAIENQLGVKIFNRVDKKLILTKDGEIVANYCRMMMSLYNNLLRDIQGENEGSVVLNVGITHTMESNIISEVIAKFASLNKGIKVRLITDSLPILKDSLIKYELDFAVMDGRIIDPKIENRLIDTDALMLIVDPDHPYAGKRSVTIEEVKNENLILRLPNSGTRDLFMAALESRNMKIDEFNVILEVDNIATIKDLIRHRYGSSVLAKSACMDEIRKNKIIALPIENLSMTKEINIACLKDYKHKEWLDEIAGLYKIM